MKVCDTIAEVRVDNRMQVMQELCLEWLSGFHDHRQSCSEIIVNGFRKAVIISALEGTLFENDKYLFALE